MERGHRRGYPLRTGVGFEKGAVPLPIKKFDFGSQIGEFWCALILF